MVISSHLHPSPRLLRSPYHEGKSCTSKGLVGRDVEGVGGGRGTRRKEEEKEQETCGDIPIGTSPLGKTTKRNEPKRAPGTIMIDTCLLGHFGK